MPPEKFISTGHLQYGVRATCVFLNLDDGRREFSIAQIRSDIRLDSTPLLTPLVILACPITNNQSPTSTLHKLLESLSVLLAGQDT